MTTAANDERIEGEGITMLHLQNGECVALTDAVRACGACLFGDSAARCICFRVIVCLEMAQSVHTGGH